MFFILHFLCCSPELAFITTENKTFTRRYQAKCPLVFVGDMALGSQLGRWSVFLCHLVIFCILHA